MFTVGLLKLIFVSICNKTVIGNVFKLMYFWENIFALRIPVSTDYKTNV